MSCASGSPKHEVGARDLLPAGSCTCNSASPTWGHIQVGPPSRESPRATQESLALPIYPELAESQIAVCRGHRHEPVPQVIPRNVATLSRQLSLSHAVLLLALKEPMQRDFYAQMGSVERRSVRTLRDAWQESDLEAAIIREMGVLPAGSWGVGFTFVARQKRPTRDRWSFICAGWTSSSASRSSNARRIRELATNSNMS